MKVRLLFIFLILPIICFSQVPQALVTNAEVDSVVQYAMSRFNVAGVAVGIVKDGKMIHTKGYGISSSATQRPVNKNTNFAIASNTKAFTTTALALLVEEGKLRWTDKVKDHIPEFKMYNAYVTDNFNIQDLLTHRSGLGLGVGDLMFFPDGSDFTIDDVLTSFQYFKPVSAFRTQFDYDNLLYIVAGEVIERVSGMTWEEFVKERIFDPIGMDQSYSSLDQIKDESNLAKPHDSNSGKLKVLPNFERMINGAAGGIYANVDDLSQWMLLHLNQGTYGENLSDTLFNIESQREMWKIHTVTEADRNPRYNTHFSGYGLGWDLSDIKGNLMVTHTGGLPGMLSMTTLIPDMELGIVVLTNTSDAGAGVFLSVTRTLLDMYLEMDAFQWIDKYADYFAQRQASGDEVTDRVWEVVKNADPNSVNVKDYIGVYQDPWFGKVEVSMKGDQLWMTCHRSPKLNGAMHFYKANTFAVKWEYQDMNADAFAMFALDEEGRAQSIKMKGISPNIDFSFDFHDLDLQRVD